MKRTEKENGIQSEPVLEKEDVEYVEPSAPENGEEPEVKNEQPRKSLVHFQKRIIFDETPVGTIDEKFVNPKFYNSFNYSLLSRERRKMILGVISPRQGDGKTIVASNLAVSFALSMENSVVLVDLNFLSPRIHELFPTALSPGFLDSLTEPTIRVVSTKIRNLSVLPAGDIRRNALRGLRNGNANTGYSPKSLLSGLGLEQLVEFRNIIFSLREEFDLIIVDLPSIDESKALSMFMKQLDGIIIVINAGRTKKEDLDKLLGHMNENQISGFVFNRTAAGRS